MKKNLFSISAIIMMFGALALPIMNASAEGVTVDKENGGWASKEVDVEINVGSTLKLELDSNSVKLKDGDKEVLSSGDTATGQTVATVWTNNYYDGYELQISASGTTVGHEADLVHTDGNHFIPADAAPTVSGGGWYITSKTGDPAVATGAFAYTELGPFAVSTTPTTLIRRIGLTDENGETTTVTYHVQSSDSQAGGTYTGKVTYTATVVSIDGN